MLFMIFSKMVFRRGMAGMAMAGIAADGWSVAGAAACLAVWTVDDGGYDAAGRDRCIVRGD